MEWRYAALSLIQLDLGTLTMQVYQWHRFLLWIGQER